VAALTTSASAEEDGPVVVLSGEADATTASLLHEMLLVARVLEITGADKLIDVLD
jgi:hypothetical protein